MQSLTIRRPDDWHVHLRDGDMLRLVAPFTAHQFGRAIVNRFPVVRGRIFISKIVSLSRLPFPGLLYTYFPYFNIAAQL